MQAVRRLERVDQAGLIEAAGRKPAPRPGEQLSELSHLNDQPSNPNYTAAQNSNIFGSVDPNASNIGAINVWGTSVFHGIGIIDPRLKTVGFGSYRTTASTPRFKTVAALNCLQGLDLAYRPSYPVMWPAGNFRGFEFPYS
jgi:hypothetical protein